jgi:hypothetical protein
VTAGRFGQVAAVDASVWCSEAHRMDIDLTLIHAGSEVTRHFGMTHPDQTEVRGTVTRRCTSPGWYQARAFFNVSAPGIGFQKTLHSDWVFLLCGLSL